MRDRLKRRSASCSDEQDLNSRQEQPVAFGRRGAALLVDRDVERERQEPEVFAVTRSDEPIVETADPSKSSCGASIEAVAEPASDQAGKQADDPPVVATDEAPVAGQGSMAQDPPAQDPPIQTLTTPGGVGRDDAVAVPRTPADALDDSLDSAPPSPAMATKSAACAHHEPLAHVISVAGSVVWGLFESGSDHPVEIGNIVRLQGGGGRSFGIVTTLRRDGRRHEDDRRLVEIKLLGEVPEGASGFQCGVSKHPALDSPIFMADQDELLLIYRQPDVSTVRLGTLRQANDLPAYAVTDQLLGTHFAILGTTGAGKSCAVTVLLRAILESNPFGHIVMLDPHNEYGQAFGDRAELLNPTTLKLPYWLLNFEEISEVLVNKESADSAYAESAILRDAILRARKVNFGEDKNSDHITVDTPTPYRLSELIRIIKENMGAFNRADSVAPFQHLISRIERVASDRRFSFMFSSFMVQDSMGQVMSSILRFPVNGKPVTIIDLSGMPSEIVDVVVSVLFRLVFSSNRQAVTSPK
jgi:hypothetical protein